MDFTSGEFFVFCTVVFFLYYIPVVHKWQQFILIVASLVFYAWQAPILLMLLACSCLISSWSSYGVLTANNSSGRIRIAALGVVANLMVLAFFKYKFLFFDPSQLRAIHAGWTRTVLLLPLPIGISFYTFHGISLLVDCYRGKSDFFEQYKPNFWRHIFDTLLYLVFFPQLIAGPIVKSKDFFPQIQIKRFTQINWDYACNSMIVGFFLKMVIANNMQDQTFWMNAPYYKAHSTLNLSILLMGYSVQIFADFAGYSLIALGLAALFGYRLPENFNFPYISQSIAEFWQRWHISLSSWLRDYLYIPLGGNRKGMLRTYLNLIIVMFLGGLWHGAAWSFAIWGLWHGVGLCVERFFFKIYFVGASNRVMIMLRVLFVFTFVSFGWLFFKLQNFSDVIGYVSALITHLGWRFDPAVPWVIFLLSLPVIIYHLAYILCIKLTMWPRAILNGILLFFIMTNAGPNVAFVYFQF
ncbi:MAG: MBOAT family O-acyltransferase [Desulfocapsaceae bacterium]|nr:MBOAT family O-acyltransferase [Desulfocapsaceae bacterium]